ncbi:MAG: MBL fold metallo-hydrolase [Anaerovoracaceae bacterium]|jgi:phosphoribosyl 1,2-cyclic phosphodiesterase
MCLSFCSFSSGSSGNCYLIKSETTALLVDAGISAKKIIDGLDHTGTPMDSLKGLLITHEHTDHVKGAKTFMKKAKNALMYATEKTFEAAGFPDTLHMESVLPERDFQIGDIGIRAFRLSHDAADPVGYSFSHRGKQISVITDTGIVYDEVLEQIIEADLLVLEANYDVDMLKIGRYPWFLKQRIAGDKGHLSNEAAGQILLRLLSSKGKERKVLLAHMSRENNFPAMAYQTVKNILEEGNYYIGKHLELSMIVRDEISGIFQT